MFYLNQFKLVIFLACLFLYTPSAMAENTPVPVDQFNSQSVNSDNQNTDSRPEINTGSNFIQGNVNTWENQNNIDTFSTTSPVFQNLNPPQTTLGSGWSLKGSKSDLASTCLRWLETYHSENLILSKNLSTDAILEIRTPGPNLGGGDRIGKILDLFNIPYISIKSAELKNYSFAHTKIIILNGTGIGCLWKTNMDETERSLLKDFVYKGGYLIATTSSCRIIEKIFPEYLKIESAHNPVLPFTLLYQNAYGCWDPNMDLELTQINSSLLLGCPVYSEVESGRCIVKLRSASDTILLTSRWQQGYRNGSNVAAVEFTYGNGKVLCYAGYLRPATTAQSASATPGIYALPPQGAGQALCDIVDILQSPKQIGAAQFVTINFILQKLEQIPVQECITTVSQ